MAEAGVPVRGGDTTRADAVVITVTALGRAERVPGRAGAQPGDLLVVTGPLGGAGAAFRGASSVRPPLRTAEGRELARAAHAMLDLSDGLGPDAGHIARRSGCKLVIDLDAVPLAPGATLDDLGFGEDYELLAAVETRRLRRDRPRRGGRRRRAPAPRPPLRAGRLGALPPRLSQLGSRCSSSSISLRSSAFS